MFSRRFARLISRQMAEPNWRVSSSDERVRKLKYDRGSFNDVSKLSPSVRGLWAEILTRLPDSRIFFAGVPQGPARPGRASLAVRASRAR